jgi:hypothetical protein
MNNTSTVKFYGYIRRLDKNSEDIFVEGKLTKVKDKITSGFYKMKSNKTKELVPIPFTITGYIDNNGNLIIQTWTNTYLKGILRRNETTLSGLNNQKIPIEWSIKFHT